MYDDCEIADLCVCVCGRVFKFNLISFYHPSPNFIKYTEFMTTELCNNFRGVQRFKQIVLSV